MQNFTNNVVNISIDSLEDGNTLQKNSKFDAKNYLNTQLQNGENEKVLKIRLLTIDKDSNTPFKHIFRHNLTVNKQVSSTGHKNYICLHKTHNEKCPICEDRIFAYSQFEKLHKEGKIEEANQWKMKSVKLIPNEAGIIRCIERGHEEDGPKFWAYNLRSDKLDPENQILELFKNKKEDCIEQNLPVENILDLYTGYDLKVIIKRVFTKDGRATNKKTIQITLYGNSKPVTENKELLNKWVNDEKKWSDVFTTKPYDYLKIVKDGKIPWFNNKENKWVEKDSVQSNSESVNAKPSQIQTEPMNDNSPKSVYNEEDDGDNKKYNMKGITEDEYMSYQQEMNISDIPF